VLTVDGDQQPSSTSLRLERELAGSDETLLVGEGEMDTALERPQRRRQPGEADDGVEDEIRLGPVEQLRQVTAYLRQRRQALDPLRARGGGTELELGMGVDDLERLAPDRARGAQQRNPFHA
jgi:hypothetical protein